MLDMSEVVDDDFASQPFSILRSSSGTFVQGVYQQQTTTVAAQAVISVASARDLEQVPEGDRVMGMMVFHSTSPIFETSKDRGGTSDILIWRGEQYRVSNVFPYGDYGYVKAFAVRTAGA